MEISDSGDPELYSSSEIKKDNLHKLLDFDKKNADLVLGTARFGEENLNPDYCVTGSTIFIYNFHPIQIR